MERTRLEGKRIGRPSVIEREGFAQQFTAGVERLAEGVLSRRKAAMELDIGYATLKRLIDARVAAVTDGATSPGPSTTVEQAESCTEDLALATVPG